MPAILIVDDSQIERIVIARLFAKDQVAFNEVGNEVTIVKLADEVTERVADLIADRKVNQLENDHDLLSQFIRRLQRDSHSGPAGELSSS